MANNWGEHNLLLKAECFFGFKKITFNGCPEQKVDLAAKYWREVREVNKGSF